MKKTLAILFAVVLAVCMCVPSFALTLDTAESAAEATVIPEDASLQAETIVPGLNVINGEAAIETFDDLTAIPSTITWSGWTAMGLSADNAVTGNAIKATSGAQYPHLYFDMVAETGRKFYVHAASMLVQNGSAATGGGGAIWWFMQDGASSNHVFTTVGGYSAGKWSVYDNTVTSKTAEDISFQMQTYKTDDVYYDDLAFVPYYKITYAGTTETVEYVLFADESVKDLSKLMTTYTVKTDNLPEDQVINGVYSKCIGWSTTEGATEPMTEVALANADIKLYPVWAEGDFVTTEGTYMLGKKGTTFTITAAEPVEWTYDVKDTGATVETTETTLTITAAGYAGYVNYSVTSKEDATKTVSAELRLIGGDYYKPGINLWTGTEEPYGFEDVDPSIVVNSDATYRDKELVTVGGMSIAKKAKVDNADNMAVYFSGNFPHITMKEGTLPVVEAARPIYVAYNKMGTKGASYPIIRNALNSADGKVRLRVDGIPEQLSDWEHYYTAVTPDQLAISNLGSPYKDDTQDVKNIVFMKANSPMDAWLDDVMVAPYYKVTYCDAEGVPTVEEYVLIDENGNFLEYYVPDNSKIAGATGFALEMGGEKVAKVALNNEDIMLYAIKDDIVTYAKGDTVVNAAVEGDEFTFPAAEDVFEGGVANFKAWYVAGKNYYPGDKVASSEVIGKVIEPVAFTAKLFDPVKGILVAYADFEQIGAKENTFAYINTDYTSSITGLDAVNGIGSRAVEAVDGEYALRARASASAGYRFGFYNMTINEDAVYRVGVSTKAIAPKGTGTDSVPLASRFAGTGGFIRINPGNSDYHFNSVLTTNWQTFEKSKENTSFTGTGINIAPAKFTNDNGTPDDTSDDLTRYYKTEYYLDDFYVYCYPKNLVMFRASATTDDYFEHRAADITGTYKFPNPLELGLDIPYFVAWTDGENKYKVGEEVAFSTVQYKNFYAYVQDPTTPAMGYAFEGNSTGDVVKKTYAENMIDDGRTVLHIHQWGSTWDSRGYYVSDTRTHIKHAGFDSSVYNVVEYAAKVENAQKAVNNKPLAQMTPEDYAPIDETEVRIFYYTNKGATGVNFFGDGGEHLVGNGPFKVPVNDGYTVMTFDMGVKANGNATYPWVSPIDGTIYGLVVDPNKSGTFAGDMYIDYLRVYKGGDTTVTYDTNAPEGATVVTEVAADTGRGVGTGYLLTGKRPEVEGYVFKGWATTADSTETVLAIDLTDDTTVYAVWESADTHKAPAATEEYEIRGKGTNNGLRFKATIKNSEMTGLEEFGFIATRKALLGENELTFAFKQNGANKKLYVSGVAYNKADGINMINGEEDDGSIIYTAVATGIPMANKDETMVMRTYAKYHINNMDVVIYGGNMQASLVDVAQAIKDANGEAYANNKEYIDSILG